MPRRSVDSTKTLSPPGDQRGRSPLASNRVGADQEEVSTPGIEPMSRKQPPIGRPGAHELVLRGARHRQRLTTVEPLDEDVLVPRAVGVVCDPHSVRRDRQPLDDLLAGGDRPGLVGRNGLGFRNGQGEDVLATPEVAIRKPRPAGRNVDRVGREADGHACGLVEGRAVVAEGDHVDVAGSAAIGDEKRRRPSGSQAGETLACSVDVIATGSPPLASTIRMADGATLPKIRPSIIHDRSPSK